MNESQYSPQYVLSYKHTKKRSLDCPRKRFISKILQATTDESPMHEIEEEEFKLLSSLHHTVKRIQAGCALP
jgi:hypothetical protein